jgi:signal transduction histidine kinase
VELIQTLEHLRGTQEKLIQSEKLASLGPIVAGIAHEINTPLGNAQLVASTLNNRVQVFGQATSGGLTRKALTELLNELETGTQLVTDNLTRAVGLVQQFKNAVVDRSVSKQSSSLLADQIYKIELLLQPVLKCHIQCFTYAVPQSIEMTTDAGALEQVITNLVNNSLIHAFGDKDDGRMHLEATIKGQKVVFIYTDDGRGMDNEVLAKIFDPFFSTRFGQGGSGLGMFVVYNLVTTALAGSIQVESGPGKGFRCTIEIPKTTPAKRSASRSRT